VVIQPATYHRKVFVFLQHKRRPSTPQAQTRSNLVIYSAANHEAGVVVATAEASFSLTSTFLPALDVAFGCRTKIASDIKTGPRTFGKTF
jgi:hypothetical protein